MNKLILFLITYALQFHTFNLMAKSCDLLPQSIQDSLENSFVSNYSYASWNKSCIIIKENDSDKHLQILDQYIFKYNYYPPTTNEIDDFNFKLFLTDLTAYESNGIGIKINDIAITEDNDEKTYVALDNAFALLVNSFLRTFLSVQLYLDTPTLERHSEKQTEKNKTKPDENLIYFDQLPIKVRNHFFDFSQEIKNSLIHLQKLNPEAFICNIRNLNLDSSIKLKYPENLKSLDQLTIYDLLISADTEFLNDLPLNGKISDQIKESKAYRILERNNFLRDIDSYICTDREHPIPLTKNVPIETPPSIADTVGFSDCWTIGIDELMRMDSNPLKWGFHLNGAGQNECHFIGANWFSNGKSVSDFKGRLVKIIAPNSKQEFSVNCPNLKANVKLNGELFLELDKKSCQFISEKK